MNLIKKTLDKIIKIFLLIIQIGQFTLSLLFCAIVIFCLIFIRVNDESVVVTKYNATSNKIANQIKIVQISDLHDFNNIEELIIKVKQEKPDIIVTTGDMFDGNRPDIRNTISFYEGLVLLDVPVYYVSGNHEETKPELLTSLVEQLENLGVRTLKNEVDTVQINKNEVNIIGLNRSIKYSKQICELDVLNNNLNIVLCHFPEDFDKLLNDEELYYGEDLAWDMNFLFTGHAHGGQIRFFNKGIYSPSQGLLPKYTHGINELTENEKIIVNSGLGNSTFPIRINNQPEIVSLVINPE